MEPYLNDIDYKAQQYLKRDKKYSGHIIMSTLESLGNVATAKAVTKYIAGLVCRPKDIIQSEVRRTLHRGVRSGFIRRRGKHYFLSNQDNSHQIDGCYGNKSKKQEPTKDVQKKLKNQCKLLKWAQRKAQEVLKDTKSKLMAKKDSKSCSDEKSKSIKEAQENAIMAIDEMQEVIDEMTETCDNLDNDDSNYSGSEPECGQAMSCG